MPSKLRKAIGAVKDQTSISLAKVANNNAVNLEVSILKATSHDDVPIDERYLSEILQLIASNKAYASACAQTIGRRISKTRNWVVVLKSLMIVLRIFQDGDPYFPREVLHAMKRGAKILNLSNFRDDSNSSPWDYTAFVRTFSLYLDERLDCFLTGKLQRRFTYKETDKKHKNRRGNEPVVRDMKPPMLLDRITYWQKLLERAIATRPTGAAKTNRLVLISLYAVVKETFDLYRDISDGLALLLDSFFHLPYQSCVNAFQSCVRASKQFEELSDFFNLCKSIGVGRTSEYPSVQKISGELIETLQEFLKDQASFPGRTPSSLSPLPTLSLTKDMGSTSERGDQGYEQSERGSETGSRCTSLEDLMSAAESATSPSRSVDDIYSEHVEKKQNQQVYEDSNAKPEPVNQPTNFDFDFLSFDDDDQRPQPEKQQEESMRVEDDGERSGWELVLVETAKQPVQSAFPDNLFDQSFTVQNQYNPFLQDAEDHAPTANPTTSSSSPTTYWFAFAPPSSNALQPTFSAQNFFEQKFNDPATTATPKFFPQSFSQTTTVAAPTFFTQKPDETTTATPNFFTQTTAEKTFGAQKPNETTTATPNFFAQSFSESTTMAPTFHAHNSIEKTSTMTPSTFHAQSPSHTTTTAASTSHAQHLKTSETTDVAPTFCATSPNDMSMALTIFGEQNWNETSMEPTFCVQNTESSPRPSFSAQSPMKTSMVGFFSENDPFGESTNSNGQGQMMFGSGSSTVANQQNVEHEQQLWLEIQNKIIAKHMSS
ncbi:hypothetical protein FNV43_RR13086 [Rhamnella rubrinervis]|uniref:ENTH domain-containing protein n=1 Tax=Rhamnella rubrinervis TaxID=2594499 RepID=A0A8K0MDL0_9ROSA|nr:hypothetical protein FNV43_RR13086 [Rhamnella rubrinervis]